MADIVRPGETAGGPLNSGAMPENVDLHIYRGDYVELYVTIKNENGTAVSLTGYTTKASIRANYDASTAYNFTTTLTGTPGQVKIFMSSAVSATMAPGSYIWDFQLTNPSGEVRTYLTGDVVVYNEVTT